jgi:hypothetical protein
MQRATTTLIEIQVLRLSIGLPLVPWGLSYPMRLLSCQGRYTAIAGVPPTTPAEDSPTITRAILSPLFMMVLLRHEVSRAPWGIHGNPGAGEQILTAFPLRSHVPTPVSCGHAGGPVPLHAASLLPSWDRSRVPHATDTGRYPGHSGTRPTRPSPGTGVHPDSSRHSGGTRASRRASRVSACRMHARYSGVHAAQPGMLFHSRASWGLSFVSCVEASSPLS